MNTEGFIYLFDVRVDKAEVRPDIAHSQNGRMEFIFKTSNCDGAFHSPLVECSENPEVQCKFRFILSNVLNLNQAFLFLQFVQEDPQTQTMNSIGVSKVRMSSFPIGSPRSLTFMCMSTTNSAIRVAKIFLTATLTSLPNIPLSTLQMAMTSFPHTAIPGAMSHPFLFQNQKKYGYNSAGVFPHSSVFNSYQVPGLQNPFSGPLDASNGQPSQQFNQLLPPTSFSKPQPHISMVPPNKLHLFWNAANH